MRRLITMPGRQYSLRALLAVVSAVGPTIAVGRWLLNLNWQGALFLAVASGWVAIILASQAALLKIVARRRGD